MSTKNVPGLQDEEVLIGKGVPEPDESGNFGSIGGAVYATYAPWVVWNPGGNPGPFQLLCRTAKRCGVHSSRSIRHLLPVLSEPFAPARTELDELRR